MKITNAEYIGSFPTVDKCPDRTRPEYVFIGRSNVGKSSLINMLTKRKALAKVSGTPGKTQMINFFDVDKTWTLVDLPGYGYARVSKKHRASLAKMIHGYMEKRRNLACAFILVDGYIPPQKVDLEFINWMGEKGVPFVLVFTKLDRLNPGVRLKNVELFKAEMSKEWAQLPQMFLTSSVDKLGREEILRFIGDINQNIEDAR